MDAELTANSAADFLVSGDAHRIAASYSEALKAYRQQLGESESVFSGEQRVELRIRIAECCHALGQYEEARDTLTVLLSSTSLDDLERARVIARVGWEEFHLGNVSECIDLCGEATSLLLPSAEHGELAQALRWLGYALRARGHFAEATEALRDALAAAKRGPDRSQLASCCEALGNLCRQRGLYEEAVSFHSRALDINTQRGDRSHVAKDLFNLGLAGLYAGEWKRALEALERSHRISAELGLERGILLVDITLCRLHRRRGEQSTARELATRALRRAQETSDARATVLAHEELGDVAREGGDSDAARGHYDAAWKAAIAIAPEGDLVYELAWRRALLALDREDVEGADALARRALELAEKSSDIRESANALRTIARIQFRRGAATEALSRLEDALRRARSIQAPYEMAEMHEAFSELVAPRGPVTPSAALAHLFEARRLFTNLGARAAAMRVEQEVARLEEMALDEGAPGRPATTPRASRAETRELIARDSEMLRLIARARELASTDSTILLQGDTGTGKELLARLIHDAGPRGRQPFVPLNCAALPTHLLESELFGHRRGSFTGADQDRVGLFASAGEGTVFLDEIDKAPPEFQTKLLRVIEDRRVRPVGATREVTIQARILCATNRDLRELADGGRFLPDLYYRLTSFRLVVPPLRERPDDLWALVDHYLASSATRFGAASYTLTKDARTAMTGYEWPGNVRELRNVLEAAAFFARGTGVIDRDDLPGEIVGASDRSTTTLDDRIEKLERREITLALRRSAGNKTLAAQMLGVSRKGLLDRLHRLGILQA